MKRFSSLLKGKSGSSTPAPPAAVRSNPLEGDSPEAIATGCVRSFCEAGSASNSGDEVSYLPTIVETAESSPNAAAACAKQIRTYLSTPSTLPTSKSQEKTKPHVQYNAIMLIRILCDNPGPGFTRNFDSKFINAVKDCLRNSRDPSVQTILRETLTSLEAKAAEDPNLAKLLQAWDKEKAAQPSGRYSQQLSVQSAALNQYASGHNPYGQSSSRRPSQLPTADELSARIEEARTTAKLLIQLIQSTPPEEVRTNELLQEFADRCLSAQRSMQGYMNLGPDPDTFQTLIETCEQLNVASSRYQRALLAEQRSRSTDHAPTLASVNGVPPPNGAPARAPTLPQIPPATTNGDPVSTAPPPSSDPIPAQSPPALALRTRNPYVDVPRLRQPSPRSSAPPAGTSHASDLHGLDLSTAPDYPLTATGFPPVVSHPTASPALTPGGPRSLGGAAETKAQAEAAVDRGLYEAPSGPPPGKGAALAEDVDDLYGAESPVANPFLGKGEGEGRVRDV